LNSILLFSYAIISIQFYYAKFLMLSLGLRSVTYLTSATKPRKRANTLFGVLHGNFILSPFGKVDEIDMPVCRTIKVILNML